MNMYIIFIMALAVIAFTIYIDILTYKDEDDDENNDYNN